MNRSAVNSTRGILTILLFFLVDTTLAQAAPQIVNVCGTDNAAGGLNLATAVAAGGEIVIRCPAGQQIIVLTTTLKVNAVAHLDGEGKVSLRGPVAGPLFTVANSLRLSGMTVENPRTAATAGAPGAGSIVVGPKASIALDNVTTQNSLAPYTAHRFSAQGSRFLNNGDPTEQGAYAAIINAAVIQLSHATFTGNFDHPIASGPMPDGDWPALSRTVLIEDTVFTSNRSSLLLPDARVSIDRSQFVSNGAQPGKWGQAWGCCGGALTLIRSDAEISGTTFRGNASSGFGGAIYALGSRLQIADSVFQRNSARAGGAILFWGRRPKVNVWGVGDPPAAPRLELRHTQFLGNSSTTFGGALLFAGAVEGSAVLLRANQAQTVGGAIADWSAGDLVDPYDGVMQALVDNTQPGQPDSIALARPIMVENVAGTRGAALATTSANMTIGNGLIARNQLKALSGGALSVSKSISLMNTTIADNPAGGVVTETGSTLHLGNTIWLRNTHYNCLLHGPITSLGSDFQYPGNSCGATVAVRDAGLDGQYAPGLTSAARGAGIVGLCAAEPQVNGVDLFGRPRLQGGHCDAGAIELPLPQAFASALGIDATSKATPRLLWLLFWLLLLLFLLGFFLAFIWRRRRKKASIA